MNALHKDREENHIKTSFLLGYIKPKLSSEKKNTDKIVDAVVQDFLPLSFVQGSGFRGLIEYLNWDIESHVLTSSKVFERHTSENIYHDLTNVADDWDIKINAVVHDNARNITGAIRQSEYPMLCPYITPTPS